MNVYLILTVAIPMQYVKIQLGAMNVYVNQDIMEMELNVYHVLKTIIHLMKQHVFLVPMIQ